MSVISGLLNYSAAGDAAEAQGDAARYSADMQYKMYMQGRSDTAPWRETGGNALAQLWKKVQMGPGEYEKSPGYQARLNEAQKGITRNAQATGGVGGGKMAVDLMKYGEDYATNDYQNFLSNYYKSLTPYQSLAGVGQTSAEQGAQNAMQTGQGMGMSAMYGGNAAAGGYINQANAITGAANSGLNTYLAWKNTQGYGSGGAGGGYGTTSGTYAPGATYQETPIKYTGG